MPTQQADQEVSPDERITKAPCKQPAPPDHRLRPHAANVRFDRDIRHEDRGRPEHGHGKKPDDGQESSEAEREPRGQQIDAEDENSQTERPAAIAAPQPEIPARQQNGAGQDGGEHGEK
jgi:hypothetical protein